MQISYDGSDGGNCCSMRLARQTVATLVGWSKDLKLEKSCALYFSKCYCKSFQIHAVDEVTYIAMDERERSSCWTEGKLVTAAKGHQIKDGICLTIIREIFISLQLWSGFLNAGILLDALRHWRSLKIIDWLANKQLTPQPPASSIQPRSSEIILLFFCHRPHASWANVWWCRCPLCCVVVAVSCILYPGSCLSAVRVCPCNGKLIRMPELQHRHHHRPKRLTLTLVYWFHNAAGKHSRKHERMSIQPEKHVNTDTCRVTLVGSPLLYPGSDSNAQAYYLTQTLLNIPTPAEGQCN